MKTEKVDFFNQRFDEKFRPNTKVDFSQERQWLCTKISTTRISHAFPASVISLSGYRNIEKSRFHPTCQNYVEIGPSRSIKSGRKIRVVEIFVHNHRLSCEKSTLAKIKEFGACYLRFIFWQNCSIASVASMRLFLGFVLIACAQKRARSICKNGI